jgi:hypothetical protein
MKTVVSILLVVFVLLLIPDAKLAAQDSPFKKGDKTINLGIGFGSSYYSSYYTSHFPAISASFEVAVKDGIADKGSIGVGGYVGYSSAKYANYWKSTNFVIAARGSFHYPFINKLDTYTGLQLGYNIYSNKYYDTYAGEFNASSSGIGFAWFVGARYYFTNTFAGMVELGYGVAYFTLGVAIKI